MIRDSAGNILTVGFTGQNYTVNAIPPSLPEDIPDLTASPTKTSTATGLWSAGSTWVGGVVPVAGDVVLVNTSHTVTYDVNSTALLTGLGIKGVLTFQTATTTQLRVGDLLVYETGSLIVGTSGSPITGSATILFAGTLQTGTVSSPGIDPEEYGIGLIVLGTVTMHGVTKTPFRRLGAEVAQGTTAITLGSAVTSWNIGDEIVIPDSTERSLAAGTAPFQQWQATGNFQRRYDRKTIANLSGTNLTLNSATSWPHPGGKNRFGVAEYFPHVGNLSRTITLGSVNPTGLRGHTIFTHRAAVDIRYTRFENLGRTTLANLNCTLFTFDAAQSPGNCTAGSGPLTQIGTNQKGRYAVHFHHLWGPINPGNTGYQFTFIGNSVVDGTKWPVAVHQSSYGRIHDNVVSFGFGPGIMFEDGSESYNEVYRNFVTAMEAPGIGGDPREQEGREPAGLWMNGAVNNYFVDNVAAGMWNWHQQIVNEIGFKFLMRPAGHPIKIPNFRGADLDTPGEYTTANAITTPVLQFSGNEAYGMCAGLTVWHHGTNGYAVYNVPSRTIVSNLIVWNFWEEGVFAYPMAHWTFDGFITRSTQASWSDFGFANSLPVAWHHGDYKVNDIIVKNFDIQGAWIGIASEEGWDGEFTVESGSTYSRIGVLATSFASPGNGAGPVANRTEYIRNVTMNSVFSQTFNTIYKKRSPYTQYAVPTLPETTNVINYNATLANFNVYYVEQISQNVSGGLSPCSDITTYPDIHGVVCGQALSGALADFAFSSTSGNTIPNVAGGSIGNLIIQGSDFSVSGSGVLWNAAIGGFTHAAWNPANGTWANISLFANTFTQGTIAVRSKVDAALLAALGQASFIGIFGFRPNPDSNPASCPLIRMDYHRGGPGDPLAVIAGVGSICNGNFNDQIESITVADASQFHNFIMVWDSATLRVWVDGANAQSMNRACGSAPGTQFGIQVAAGSYLVHSDDRQFLTGTISRMLIYDRELSDAEIVTLNASM